MTRVINNLSPYAPRWVVSEVRVIIHFSPGILWSRFWNCLAKRFI